MIICLRHFALTGKFGPISVGMHQDDVIRILGEPGDVQDFGTGFSGIIYGWYEFFFDNSDDTLHAIQNDSCSKLDPTACEYHNEHFEVDPWIFRFSQWYTFNTTKQYLNDEGITYLLQELHGSTVILLESGVYFDFEVHGDDPDIIGLRYFPSEVK